MAKKKGVIVEEVISENISIEPLEEVMGDRYATYAKYVIQDRAIPDVKDGLKPVQRRIIFSMFKNGNTYNKPTRKCAHTVGAVMGTYHPHGDTSIYEALARMSQDWKVRYPLIDFQGNNGSIDGDSPAAYRYTESRLSELSNELIRDIDKNTVDMQLNFDDTEFEPIVLPSRFPNLFCNGTEGIAVALATEIPPHNLKEVIDAVIYRIEHKNVTTGDLLQFVKGPDFPGGGIVYESDGLKNIYLEGRGRIEVAAKTDIVQNKDITQIIISEIPYKVVKNQLVYEIDKIIHSKTVDGLLEVRDESDWKGIRIVIDCKKDAKIELLLNYLKSKTSLVTSYSANMVAIVDGRPKTLTLLDYIDSYIKHQDDVITRKSKFDLEKYNARLHIVEGLIIASININEVVNIIKSSNDKADSKVNLMAKYNFSNEQAEAIVTMPLYKLSHSDEMILKEEKASLLKNIETLKGILSDSKKLDRVLIKDLKEIADKYGDDRRTSIQEKEVVTPIDKRDLIAKEEVMIAVTRDGYIKRSSVKSFKGSNDSLPGIKDDDATIAMSSAYTTDYLLIFTNLGNYITVPVHLIHENRWKDEGKHINDFVTLAKGEKLFKVFAITSLRNDIFVAILTKFGQIKRMPLSALDLLKRSRPAKCIKLLNNDEIVGVELLDGNSDILVLTTNGYASLFNENELTILSSKAAGVKAISNLGKNYMISLITFAQEERSKFVLITDKCHYRIADTSRITKTSRLGRNTLLLPCFKNDIHMLVGACKFNKIEDTSYVYLYLSNNIMQKYILEDIHLDDPNKNAKKNMNIDSKTNISNIFNGAMDRITDKTVSYYTPTEEPNIEEVSIDDSIVDLQVNSNSIDTNNSEPNNDKIVISSHENDNSKQKKKEPDGFEQISIFDDLDE